MKRFAFILAILIAAGVFLFLAIPSLVIGMEGGFQWRIVASRNSPDDRFQLHIEKRTAFPANEWVDPAMVVGFRLVNATNNQTLAYTRVTLAEDSDYTWPTVQWESNTVAITSFDRRKTRTVTLDIPDR